MSAIKINIPLYPINLYLAVNWKDLREIEDYFTEDGCTRLQLSLLYPRTTFRTISSTVEDKNMCKSILLILNRDIDRVTPPMVSHEAYHITRMIFEYIGDLDPSQEAFAYLLQYIVDKIIKILKVNNITILI